MFCSNFEGCQGVSIDVVIFDWTSVHILLDFAAKLLYGFTVPIKGEGEGVKETCALCFRNLRLAFCWRHVSSFDSLSCVRCSCEGFFLSSRVGHLLLSSMARIKQTASLIEGLLLLTADLYFFFFFSYD